jgi:hypothetical protein
MAGRQDPEAVCLVETRSKPRHVRRMIMFAALILILASRLTSIAHHNWNPLPTGTTIDRIVVENLSGDYRYFEMLIS